ncbi:MAG: hypothetical protein CM1200mP39_24430 [Dehalococcoidia bacterium]|nr:MAG: hypothetical protein CM1200mP39_24430 [Dehalococcoidia bacterium]
MPELEVPPTGSYLDETEGSWIRWRASRWTRANGRIGEISTVRTAIERGINFFGYRTRLWSQ